MNAVHLQVTVIGYLRSPLRQKFGTPRQPNLVPVPATIELLPPFDQPDACRGLGQFSHLWLIWHFHQAFVQKQSTDFRPLIRPPRLGGNQGIGVFASRTMQRPSPLGLSVVRLDQVTVEQGRTRLQISGADLIDGTPIIDIKPYLAYSDAVTDAMSGYASAPPPRLPVIWTPQASMDAQRLGLSGAEQQLIAGLLAQDPRPAFHDDEREYGMQFAAINCRFCVRQQATGASVHIMRLEAQPTT